MLATRTIVVWCADWPAVALMGTGRAGLEDPQQPCVVLRANRVVATNATARSEGVRIGSRRREAQRLCPTALVLERDLDREARAFEAVLATLDDITPRIEITRPGTVLFPARGPSRYFGGDEAVAAKLHSVVSAALLVPTAVGVGVADGVFAATLAARQAGRAQPGAQPSGAQPSGAQPSGAGGALVIPPGTSPEFLAPLPIHTLGKGELTDVLVRLGLAALGDFAGLDPADVLGRFGAEGARAHRLSCGWDERPPQLEQPPPDLEVHQEFESPLERVDEAAFVAKGLADELHERLQQRGLAALAILIEGVTVGGEVIQRRWRHEGALSSAAVAQRVRWQLDGWLTYTQGRSSRGAGSIASLRLRPIEVAPDAGRQMGFWGGADASSVRARRGIARVQGLLGSDSVKVAEWRGARAPGEQYRLVGIDTVPLAEDETLDLSDPGVEPWPGRLPDPPPALVWEQLRSAELHAADGAMIRVNRRGAISGIPAKVSLDSGPWQRVVCWAGPWLSDERWWDATSHRRRARFQIQTETGEAVLLALESQRWWYEASYD